MSQLDELRLFVQQRLSAATEDICSRFARTIGGYEAEVVRLKLEVERQDRLLRDRQEDRLLRDRQEDRLLQDRLLQDRLLRDRQEDRQEDRLLQDRLLQDRLLRDRQEDRLLRDRQEDRLLRDRQEDRPEDRLLRDRLLRDRQEDRPEDRLLRDRQEDRPEDRLLRDRLLRDRQEDRPEDRLLRDRPEDRPEDRPAGVLQVFTTEEEEQTRGRSFSPHIKQEEGGASGPDETVTKFPQSPDWLRERPETNQSPSSNQIQTCTKEAGPQPAVTKQEVEEDYMMLEAVVREEIISHQGGVLQVFTTEEEEQTRGPSFSPHVKQEEGGASGPDETITKFPQSPDWLRERPETNQSPSSNQIQTCTKEAGPQPAVTTQEVVSVKQEVEEDYMMVEAAVREEIISHQEGLLQVFTTEEEQQARGPSFSLNIKQEENGASGPHFTQSPDCLMEGYEDKDSSSSNQIQGKRDQDILSTQSNRPGQTCLPTDHPRDSAVQSEDSDVARLDPGLQRTGPGLFQGPTKIFSCKICKVTLSTEGLLVKHAEHHCKEPQTRCGACGDNLESTDILRDHLRSHKELGTTCDVCGKKFRSMKVMEIHRRVHTGERPYRCGFCTQDFGRKESLSRHLKLAHRDRLGPLVETKPHRCELCTKAFGRKHHLVQHLKTGHLEKLGSLAETKLHRCELCTKTFTLKEYLVHHLNTEHPERLGPRAGPVGAIQTPSIINFFIV